MLGISYTSTAATQGTLWNFQWISMWSSPHSQLDCNLESRSKTSEETSKEQQDVSAIKKNPAAPPLWSHSRDIALKGLFWILSVDSVTFLSLSYTVRKLDITPLLFLMPLSPLTPPLPHRLWESRRGRSACCCLIWKMVPPPPPWHRLQAFLVLLWHGHTLFILISWEAQTSRLRPSRLSYCFHVRHERRNLYKSWKLPFLLVLQ